MDYYHNNIANNKDQPEKEQKLDISTIVETNIEKPWTY